MERAATSELWKEFQDDCCVSAEDFDSLVKLYRPRIFRFILASLRDRDAAENLTQDCLLKAYKAREQFRNDCSIATWLMQIAVNVVRDHVRNRRIQFWRKVQRGAKSLDANFCRCIIDQNVSPESQTLLREKVDAIWEAVSGLPERQRTVFLLRFVEEMELLEIVAATGMKEGTVKTHLFRATQSVREWLGGLK